MKLPFFKKKKESGSLHAEQTAKPEIFKTLDQEGYYSYTTDDLLNSSVFSPIVSKISTALGGRGDLFDRYLFPSIQQKIIELKHYNF